MKNPLTDYQESKEAAGEQRRSQDLEHWKNWNENGRQPEHLEPLLKRFQPLVNQAINQWKAPRVQKAAFEAEVKKHLISAFESFDPTRASLATHATNRIRKVHRYNAKHQNMAYIPEAQVSQIKNIKKTQDSLRDEFDRDPTRDEIADRLGMPPKKLNTIMNAMKKDIFASQFETDPTHSTVNREHEVLELIEPDLTPEELQVFNHLYGRGGAKKIDSTNDLARTLGKNPSQISRLRTSILNKVKRFT